MSVLTKHGKNAFKHAKSAGMTRSASIDRKELVKSLRGSLAWIEYSVDQYLAEKYADTERENRL